MDIQIKSLKIAKFASNETLCFEAKVYVDGVAAFMAKSDGNGGCNMHEGIAENWQELLHDAEVWAKTLPAFDICGTEIPADLDVLIDVLINEKQAEKSLKLALKNKTVFLDQMRQNVFSIKTPYSDALKDELFNYIAKRMHHNKLVILNTLDFDEALRIYLNPKSLAQEEDNSPRAG